MHFSVISTTALFLALTIVEPLSAGKPAARTGDMHVCPMVTGMVPHVGGPLLPAVTNVLICGKPAANIATLATCAGPPDRIIKGSSTVMIGGLPAARRGDATLHGGTITQGCPTVLIGP